MAIHHQIDEATRRFSMCADGDMSGREIVDFICAQVEARPELLDWDWIHDLRQATGPVDNEDVLRTAKAFAAQGEPAWTVFVSKDPNLAVWAKVMDHQFTRRLHLTAFDMDAAHRLLDRKRAG